MGQIRLFNLNMQNSPLVSVICISYNHSPFVIQALESIINQTYNNIELIIADDFSTDDSVKIITDWIKKSDKNIPFVINTDNIGNTKTFNKAFKFSKGEYIIDLAADDILLPNCIEEQVKAFQKTSFSKVGIVYGNIELIDEQNNFISTYYGKKDNPESGDIYKMVISLSTKICSVASMIKREVFETVGYYDETLAYEDLDLWIRASKVYDFQYIPKTLAQKRELSTSLSAHFFKKNNTKTKRMHESSYKILRKAYSLNSSQSEHRALLKRVEYEILRNLYSRNLSYLHKYFLFYIKIIAKSIIKK